MARKRKPSEYKRREPEREPYDYVLIVCEGKQTETQYFGRLIKIYNLSNANIEITHANGTDPLSIVRFAEALYLKKKHDRVYCVFDRDGHTTWDAGLELILKYPGVMFAAKSWPCFELWILLHFKYSASPFNVSGNKSSCDAVMAEIKKVHMKSYRKGHPTIFDDLAGDLERAKKHARKLAKENAQTGSLNPSTNVYELVEYLIGLADKRI